MPGYSKHFQVVHFLGFVTNRTGTPWMVLETGDPKVWLFCQGYPEDVTGNRNCFVATGLQNPVEKKRLVDVVRQVLSAGLNVDMRTDPPTVYGERMTLHHVPMQKKVKEAPPVTVATPPPPKRLR